MPRERTIVQERRIVELTRYYCSREIGEMIGVSKSTVLKVQHKYHLVQSFGRSHSSAQFDRRNQWDEEEWGAKLEQLYGVERLPIAEIARRCNAHPNTIRKRLVHLGFGIRTGAQTQTGQRRAWRNHPKCPCGTVVFAKGETKCWRCRKYPGRLKRFEKRELDD